MARTPRSKKKNKKTTKRRPRPTISILNAANADKHELYQKSVQDAESAREFIEGIFDSRQDYTPLSLREDFCGTALLCADWVKSHSDRTAVGIDLDQPTLDWGMEKNIAPLDEDKHRVILLNQNVLEPTSKNDFDVVAAFNFSYCVFHERNVILRYFKQVHASLASTGLFVLDMHGGPDSQFQLEEPKDMDDFEYVWEQASFDPINNRTMCHIHFRFQDGSELKNAFTYDWRHWSIPELRELLEEAGFTTVDTWWDGDDDEYAIHERATNLEAWVAYLAAWK